MPEAIYLSVKLFCVTLLCLAALNIVTPYLRFFFVAALKHAAAPEAQQQLHEEKL